MWYTMPDSCDSISIERQVFHPEHTNAEGKKFFRAPDHFEPQIRALGMGWGATAKPEGVDLPDLPKEDPVRDGAIAEQAGKIQLLEDQVSMLRSDLSARDAALGATLHERDALKLKVHELEVKVKDLEGDLEEAKEAIPVPAPGKKRD